jgi:hypothetical protein
MQIWVLIIAKNKIVVGASPTAFLLKRRKLSRIMDMPCDWLGIWMASMEKKIKACWEIIKDDGGFSTLLRPSY